MKRNRQWSPSLPVLLLFLLLVLLFILVLPVKAQKGKSQKPVKPVKNETVKPDAAVDEKKVRDMVAYLGFVLNTLGNRSTSSRDKDVLITESYSKIFRDAKVQVEDDLDEERRVITNKDVAAYLKDINFFFKEVKFEFTIDKLERGVTGDQAFYKVSLQRNLSGTTVDGKAVNNNMPRFIEINFNPKEQDLKIVSIYTHEISEKDALKNWWNALSYEWQGLFKKKFNLGDSATLSDIRKVTDLQELDLGGNRFIQSFEPLSQLTHLKRLDLSNTLAKDLTPIRNLTELEELNIAHTAIQDLQPLKYSSNLQVLSIGHTMVSDIGVLERMTNLQSLDLQGINSINLTPIANLSELETLNLKGTQLTDLSPVANLKQLEELNIAKTRVQDLNPLRELKSVHTFICDSTRVQHIGALAGMDNLKVLQANYTQIADLQYLQKLPHLEKVYCDQTAVKKETADLLMKARPGVLVVYDSRDMKAWWDGLSPAWKEVICNEAGISTDPPKEELATVGNIDSIIISGNFQIRDLEPLKKFPKLKVLLANRTGILDLSPIQDCKEITHLDIGGTGVTRLSTVTQLPKLKILKADKCRLDGIAPLHQMKALEKVYVDETGVNDILAQEFLDANPKCLLVYKTVHIRRWWFNLPEPWRDVFKAQLKDTTRESFHQLLELEAFHFKDAPITDLSGLSEFMRLKELHFSYTALTNIQIGDNIKSLRSLHATNGPIQTIESLNSLIGLEDLDISNTPIDDINGLWDLKNLKSLNCAGTQIKRLDVLENLEKLESLDCSNTNVTKLTALDYLPLKVLKCYNTKVSPRSIENFQASHPDCKVIFYK